ncbi:MAG: C1 family peptidase, partial [Burkholderiaceae bacterium]
MDTLLLRKGASGPDVDKLAQALAAQLGADASAFPALQKWTRGAAIDDAFDAAIRRWQAGIGIIADGIVGPRCQVLLELAPAPGPAFEASDSKLNVARVSQLFPATKPANIARYLPYLEAALARFGLVDRATVLCALGTIRAETEGFVPIDEFQSRFNTAAGGPPYGLYDDRPSLGNKKPGDGALYKGRGFVQLTGHDNYAKYGALVGIDLVSLPQLANAPEVAAVLLASFLHSHAEAIRADVAAGDLAAARKIVNGGTHGLDQFKSVFDLAKKAFAQAAATSAAADGPATPSRRPAGGATQTSKARKDSVDLRDRQFMPAAVSLQDEFPSPQTIHEFLPAYTGAGLILNQGREGACTGFGLTCVINYLRWIKAGTPKAFESVSPRMLYTLARRHDEYEGENYEGSSCRGAIKGWFNNGVCLERHWPYAPETSNPPRYGFAEEALKTTLGVYYRVDITSVIDLQAAIAQHGAVFASAMTHTGWDETPEVAGPITGHADLPRIRFDDRMPQHSGHAFALVGFNGDGFIVQNSWGKEWGAGGFAVIQYADWLANAMDAWLVSLGVPRVVAGRLVPAKSLDGMAAAGADQSGWWDESRAYLHSIVLGNDGRVDRYVTEDEQPRNLQHQACVLPDQWFRSRPQAEPKRLVLMVHGGLNSRDDAIKRARAMGRYFLGNGCYPLFVVWQTGILESLRFLLEDQRPAADN